jgi:CBS domain-containing protein
MDSSECANPRVPADGAEGARVRDAMVSAPKTIRADGTVADLRALFANPHVLTALLVDGATFAGVIDREMLPPGVADDDPARGFARQDVPTVHPDAPLSEATRVLDATAARRLVVLDADGRTLRGLLCLTSDRDGFCQS